ncbi:sigma-70 family RNA polymerase sigma factor [Vagococcus salmoninarum]|uniref:FliA/WhiG family RNA polymerase sigma factor n=1 Tax=Vagococcus salmoninarum TaxID=2739 RepID=A0A429ZSY3_9ENTE|nr:FliA/WhiG family RNA polymerase sigma factor [Vagococcus salmoninarum]RST96798.1 FliA/WhiG family RNA polymerase sigma factor [Vagococcus salmoninarum]
MYEIDLETEIVKYLPLVEKVVNRIGIKNREYDNDDLFNIGVIGLMDALNKFDASKKVPFESYAYIRIRGTIIDEVRRTSRVSRTRMENLNEFYRAKEKIEKSKMSEASDQEICEELGITAKNLATIHETVHYLANISLEDTIFSSVGETLELKDIIEDEKMIPFDDLLLDEERKVALSQAVLKPGSREQIILNLYYVEELTLKEIAEVLDVSIPRVSQLHGKILVKLKLLIEGELT